MCTGIIYVATLYGWIQLPLYRETSDQGHVTAMVKWPYIGGAKWHNPLIKCPLNRGDFDGP